MTPAVHNPSAVPYRLNPSRYGCHMLLLDLFPDDGAGKRVLDVGCSNGYFARLLADRGFDVTGIDRRSGISESFPPNVRLIEHDLDAGLPRVDGRFDYIVCADILEHLRDPRALLRDLAALLEPGGCVLASLPNSGNLYFRAATLTGRIPQHDRGLFDRTHVHFLAWDDWVRMFADAGLTITAVTASAIPFTVVFHWPMLRLLAKAAEWLSFVFGRYSKKLFAYQFVITSVRNSAEPNREAKK
jgi:SAM-dependent methyltransferase